MADDDPKGERVAEEWPVEGHVIVPGSGLEVRRDCLGRSFRSRVRHSTGSYDLTIGLPQLGRSEELIAPMWDFGPSYESELAAERSTIRWGEVTSLLDHAYVFRCGYYATLPASDDRELGETAWDKFNFEFEFWWEAFTSWAAILASQDLVGPPEWDWSGPDREGWLIDAHGQRAGFITGKILTKADSPNHRVLELQDLEACVTAAGNQGLPPAPWLLIRDARSQANAGDDFHGRENLRRAVIDAATAAELAMTTLIDKYLDDASVLEPLRKALARSSNNLGGKKAVLNLLRPDLLHERLQENLINKRNKASHEGKHYSWEEAEAAVDIATAVVESAYPLASYLGGG